MIHFASKHTQTTSTPAPVSKSQQLIIPLPMSLLRACIQATPASRKATLQCASTLSRGMANDSTPVKKESSEIVAPEPAREVLVADVISGAPSA